jgi:hypothetical protein
MLRKLAPEALRFGYKWAIVAFILLILFWDGLRFNHLKIKNVKPIERLLGNINNTSKDNILTRGLRHDLDQVFDLAFLKI